MKRITKAVAFHEAGHAVIKWAVGIETRDVYVNHDGTGMTEGTGEVLRYATQYGVWDLIATHLAGPFAEAKASRKSCKRATDVLNFGGGTDYHQAAEGICWLVKRGYATNEDAAWERAAMEVAGWIKKHWPSIQEVAHQLMQRGRLTAKEIQAICERDTS